NGDRIFNGAIDNASGTAGLLELARQWSAGPKPERTIVMISFTGEESGLLGSEFYAANPLYPLEKTVGGFNLDSAAVFGRMNKLGVTGYGHSELDEPVIAAAAAQGRGFVGDAGAAAGIYFRSDHFPLAKKGVPMAYLSSTGDFVDAPIEPRQAKAADYRANRYHQAADEWEADWDYAGMLQDLEVMFKVGQGLANSRDWPEWKAGSEFGPERAKSAAQRRWSVFRDEHDEKVRGGLARGRPMTVCKSLVGEAKGIVIHRRFIRGVAAAALLLVAGAVSAQDFSAQRLSDEIRIISADDFQGRYPGTEGEKKTLDWLQAQYEAMGMEPGGPDGQWLQVIDLKRLTPKGQPTLTWSGAMPQGRALIAGADFTLRAMNDAAAGAVIDAPVVFAGYGIHAPERGWDDYGDLDVTGAVVLVVAGEPDGELFNGPYATNYQSAAYKADEAKRRGAVAVLTVID